MPNTVHVFDFLADSAASPAAVTVLFGDEPFLKRLARQRLVAAAGDGDDVLLTRFSGVEVAWRDVVDELSTASMFGGGRRLVLVEDADDLVKKHRDVMEDYVDRPRSTGILLLDVVLWPGNTRLYKAVDKSGLQIECRAPLQARSKKNLDTKRIEKWLVGWAKATHGLRLEAPAAGMLLELVGPEFGLLDQGLAKLALFVSGNEQVTPAMVSEFVGGWRTQTIWELTDAAADGDAAAALTQLARLLHAGEHPLALLAQMSSPLRRLAAATRIYQAAERRRERMSIRDALIAAGVPQWHQQGLIRSERQLQQLGRRRAGQLFHWLLEADLAMKGSHSTADRARFILERLIMRMARLPGATTARASK